MNIAQPTADHAETPTFRVFQTGVFERVGMRIDHVLRLPPDEDCEPVKPITILFLYQYLLIDEISDPPLLCRLPCGGLEMTWTGDHGTKVARIFEDGLVWELFPGESVKSRRMEIFAL